jgi:phosphatidylserine decarboxylase
VSFIRSAAFLRAYRWFPHATINAVARRVARVRRPRWLVQAAVRAWIRRDQIDLDSCTIHDPARFASLEELFLRRLRPGARPLDPAGVSAPVDGRVMAAGRLEADTRLPVKGSHLSLDRIVNGRRSRTPLAVEPYLGGDYAVLFLSPRGYHRVHMPVDGELLDVRWLPGRLFPQNERALVHIAGVYERNERAVLRLQPADPGATVPLLMVMVGASVVGGIELEGVSRAAWVGREPFPLAGRRARGAEIGHFTFGSTVIVVVPPGVTGPLVAKAGADVKMGERLWDPAFTAVLPW